MKRPYTAPEVTAYTCAEILAGLGPALALYPGLQPFSSSRQGAAASGGGRDIFDPR